jgi:regulator of protease activity HflC (stomatin/prohibitin superfamily)
VKGENVMSVKKYVTIGFVTVLILIGAICAGSIFETVEKGTYQVKQAAISGKMSAKMEPGLWMQNFGDIDVWPVSETFFFTADKDGADDTDVDMSIEVRFNDGSLCRVSGTARVLMPTTESDAISLVTVRGHKTYPDLEQKLILPTVRNVLRSTANLMSARESYSEKRADFINWARDQIENGLYDTDETIAQVEDLITGEKVRKAVKVIRKDKNGLPVYQYNPLKDTGIRLDNFEIKVFNYERKVQEQIAKQQEARMNVETAKAKAEEAKQDELKAIAEGKKNVAIAQYEKEQEKIKAVVDAQKDKQVAELQAQKKLEVAKLEKAAAAEWKQANILEGEGLAEKKRLILEADGALQQKLDAYVEVSRYYADAIKNYSGNWVPTVTMGETDGLAGGGAEQLINMLSVKTAKSLLLIWISRVRSR